MFILLMYVFNVINLIFLNINNSDQLRVIVDHEIDITAEMLELDIFERHIFKLLVRTCKRAEPVKDQDPIYVCYIFKYMF